MKFYSAAQHNITKAIAEINYPVTKKELIDLTGDTIIQMDFDKKIALKELWEKLPLDSFSCAGELFNNISCALW